MLQNCPIQLPSPLHLICIAVLIFEQLYQSEKMKFLLNITIITAVIHVCINYSIYLCKII